MGRRWGCHPCDHPKELLLALPPVDTSPRPGVNGDGQPAISVDATGGWIFGTYHRAWISRMVQMDSAYALLDTARVGEVAQIAAHVNCNPPTRPPLVKEGVPMPGERQSDPKSQPQKPSNWRLVQPVLFLLAGALVVVVLAGVADATQHPEQLTWPQGVVLFLGLAVAVATLYLASKEPRSAVVSDVTFRDMIAEATDHLERTSELLRSLEDELATRTALLEQRVEDAERYEALASLKRKQAKAIDDMFKRQGRSNMIFWWLGIVIGGLVGLFVNWISAPVLAWITS